MQTNNHHYIIAGVSGSGKTTVGKLLANQLSIPFYDADDFHPASNIQKMKSGKPLNDADRMPWLFQLNDLLKENRPSCVLACSALKESYRKIIMENMEDKTAWIFLQGDYDLILDRMNNRNHFMPPALLQSQFDIFEEANYGISVSINQTVPQIVEEIINKTNAK